MWVIGAIDGQTGGGRTAAGRRDFYVDEKYIIVCSISSWQEQSYSPVRRRSHRSGYSLPCISFHFTGTTHIHLPPANGSFVMPTHAARPQDLRTSVGGTGGAGRGSSGAGYHQRTQNAGHTYVPGC
ncbi:hypothetical protein QYF36_011189 [Acer negundo]|nr:hypothetical protein QYF36_011189 [Acer negundo]